MTSGIPLFLQTISILFSYPVEHSKGFLPQSLYFCIRSFSSFRYQQASPLKRNSLTKHLHTIAAGKASTQSFSIACASHYPNLHTFLFQSIFFLTLPPCDLPFALLAPSGSRMISGVKCECSIYMKGKGLSHDTHTTWSRKEWSSS